LGVDASIVQGTVRTFVLSANEEYVFLGTQEGQLMVFRTQDAEEITTFDLSAERPINCVRPWKEKVLLCGHSNGDVTLILFDPLIFDRRKCFDLVAQQRLVNELQRQSVDSVK
jgi:hypothetical protein